MAIAIVLLLLVVGSVAFHLLTPWTLTPLASNWEQMDHTLSITIGVTGLFFVVINLFVVYTLWRFRHRAGARAAYEPENKRLERWLIGVTTLGIIGLLAPGLAVYAKNVRPPEDALLLEVVGQQWQWRFRFPGAGGQFGASDTRFFGGDNPLGLDPSDKAAQDDVVVLDNVLHLPVNRPVKVVMRSHDVLHDFFVPQFRARMNIVPGQLSSFWFTPTHTGRYEAMCAQLCGVGHPVMRAYVVIEDDAAFSAWLAKQPTFAALHRPPAVAQGAGANTLPAVGGALAQTRGCTACHTIDGGPGVGPTWKGLFGKTEALADGSSVKVDAAYLRESIREPQARAVKGFPNVMPKVALSEDEISALVAYIASFGTAPPGDAPR